MTNPDAGTVLIELLIALAIFAMTVAALAALESALVTAPWDIERERAAASAVERQLERAQAGATSTDDSTTLAVTPLDACLSRATATSSWRTGYGVAESFGMSRIVSDLAEADRDGNDCGTDLPATSTMRVAARTTVISSSTAIDRIGDTAYVGLDSPPYFAIMAQQVHDVGLAARPNAIDAIDRRIGTVHHRYVYAALHATSSQLAVIDVTDPFAPVLTATSSLAAVDSVGSYPQGWRIRYYGGDLYVTTRETAGNEYHVLDAADPAHPREIGSTNLGITVNDFVLRQRGPKRYLLAAASRANGEVAAYDASDPRQGAVEIAAARVSLPGDQNAETIAELGTTLYVGRAAVSNGPELYALDASDLSRPFPIIGSAEAGSGVLALRVAWPFLYALTENSFQVWDVTDPTVMRLATSTAMKATAFDLFGTTLDIVDSTADRTFHLQ